MKRKMSLPGHNAARTGGGIQGANCPEISQLIKKVVRNFAGRIENIFEGIQEPRWPRASNSLCTPLFLPSVGFYPHWLELIFRQKFRQLTYSRCLRAIHRSMDRKHNCQMPLAIDFYLSF